MVRREILDRRESFWRRFLEVHPDAAEHGLRVSRASNLSIRCPQDALIGLYLTHQPTGNCCGVYIHARRNEDFDALEIRLRPWQKQLVERLHVPWRGAGSYRWLLETEIPASLDQEDRWPMMIDGMHAALILYRDTFTDLFGSPE